MEQECHQSGGVFLGNPTGGTQLSTGPIMVMLTVITSVVSIFPFVINSCEKILGDYLNRITTNIFF